MAASINRGINRRLEELEKRIGPPEKDEAAALQTALLHDYLDELARLKSSRAVHYRAGERIEPEDIPGKILGSDYTWEDVRELAIRRVLKRRAREDLSE
jgi:hypothetical protein